jgi:fucose 4-O-acetylase-like acetyltransferase
MWTLDKTTLAGQEGLDWLYVATWAMRVPVFAVLAGYFSRADVLTPRELRRLIESVLVPYLAFGALHMLETRYVDGVDVWTYSLLEPAGGTWFLLSLLFWRAALPYLAQLRFPLATAVVVALLAGYWVEFGPAWSLSRTLTFLPFFLLGWRLRQGVFDGVLAARWSRFAALGVVGATFAVTFFLHGDVERRWLWMKGPYEEGSLVEAPWAWVTRAAVLACGMVIALSFIRLVPRRRIPVVTYLGAGGLYVYLLHPLALRPWQSEWGFGWADSGVAQLALLGLAALVSAALASPVVRWLTRPLVQPRLPWLLRTDAPPKRSSKPAASPEPPERGDATREEREEREERPVLAGTRG